MVLATTYPTLIKQALNTYVSLVKGSPSPHVDVVCVSSDQHQQYVVRKLGWREGRRIRQTVRRAGMPVLHVALRDHKIWTSEDWTEDGIATTFYHMCTVRGYGAGLPTSYDAKQKSLPSHNVLITTRKKRANLMNRLALFFRVRG